MLSGVQAVICGKSNLMLRGHGNQLDDESAHPRSLPPSQCLQILFMWPAWYGAEILLSPEILFHFFFLFSPGLSHPIARRETLRIINAAEPWKNKIKSPLFSSNTQLASLVPPVSVICLMGLHAPTLPKRQFWQSKGSGKACLGAQRSGNMKNRVPEADAMVQQ